MGNGSGKTAPLPSGASQRVKDFVSCKLDEISIDTDKLDWMPDGPLGDLAPPITVVAGPDSSSVIIRYGSLEIPVARTPTGELAADTSNLPESGPLSPIGEGIRDWVDAFNDTMKANKKKLRGMGVDGTKVVFAKMPDVGDWDEIDPVDWSESELKLVTPAGGGAQPKPKPQPKPVAPPAPKATNWWDPLARLWKWLAGFLALLVTIAVVATVLSNGDGGETAVDTTPTLSAAGGGSVPSGSEAPETVPIETMPTETTPTETAPQPEAVAASTGTYEISARIAGPCGDFEVFLRAVLFLNGQMTVDQLLTAGGNPFQSALGRWDSRVAVATHAESTFFEAWFFLFNFGDILSIYNVTGPSSPMITADSEVDLDDYAGVTTPEQLDEVTSGSGSCSTELLDVVSSHTPFPDSTG